MSKKILVLVFLLLVMFANFAEAQSQRMWIIGDSITLGRKLWDNDLGDYIPYPSYRYELQKKLTQAQWDIDYVGTQNGFAWDWTAAECQAMYPDWPDQLHDGWSGYSSEMVLNGSGRFAGIDDVAAAMNPDIVLLHIGTNDQYKGMTFEESKTNIVNIINTIRTANSKVEFYVAAIIPVAETNALYDEIETLSGWIVSDIENYSTEDSPVYMVDMHTGYDNVNWYFPTAEGNDGVHPDFVGEAWMADRWFDALEANKVPEPATLSLLSIGIFTIIKKRKN